MWEQFPDLGAYEANVIDPTDCSLEKTFSMIMKKVADGTVCSAECFLENAKRHKSQITLAKRRVRVFEIANWFSAEEFGKDICDD